MTWKITAALAAGLIITACNTTAPTNGTSTTGSNTATNSNSAATAAKKVSSADLESLASKVVTQSAGVKEGEIVLVSGGARDMELLEDIVTEVQKAGGYALLTVDSERMTKRGYSEVPEKFDSREPKLGMALAKMANVTIGVDSTETEGLLADISPERRAARAKAGQPVGAEFMKNKVRSVSIGNGLYPTEWNAKRFEMPVDAFAKLFWEGVNIDYTDLQATGEKARTALAGKEVEITHPNGTSLKLSLESTPAYISDGVISAADVAANNLNAYLPAGEAAKLPAANSATGRFIDEKSFYQGKEMHNVVYTFENGKLTNMTGDGDGFAAMKADYELAGEGKDVFSFLDIGINSNYVLAPSTKLGNWVSAGMVSVGTGNNTWLGGTLNSTGGITAQLAGCTVKVDGKTIVENGKLML